MVNTVLNLLILCTLLGFTIDLYWLSDKDHANWLQREGTTVGTYARGYVDKASQILSKLQPPGSFNLLGTDTYELVDVVALFTRKKILCGKSQGKDKSVKGASLINGICTNQKAIIVSDDGGLYESYLTFVHELAHTMGVPHDGEKTSQKCPSNALHIMTPRGIKE
ncbi:hypothetical protein MTO96_032193 [Rhipicephalus appendiculatus]